MHGFKSGHLLQYRPIKTLRSMVQSPLVFCNETHKLFVNAQKIVKSHNEQVSSSGCLKNKLSLLMSNCEDIA